MKDMGLNLKEIASGAIGAAANAASGGIVGMGLNAVGNLLGGGGMSEEEAMKLQHQYELEKMGLQAQYNREQAKYSQDLAKEMWEYTNYENQVEHLKAAGLNPALLYGKGGAGGSTAGAGTAQGVGMGASEAVGMALQARGLKLTQSQQQAEIAKTVAETAKLAGVDTESVKTSIKEMLQDIEASKTEQEETKARTAKTNAETKVIEFTDWLNEAKRKLTYWEDGESGNYADMQAKLDFQRTMTEEYGLSKQEAEYIQDKKIINKLEKHLDEIVNGKVALYREQIEKAKQAKNETAQKRWEFEQEKALSDIIEDIGGDGKYGRILSKITSAIFGKWAGYGKTKRE